VLLLGLLLQVHFIILFRLFPFDKPRLISINSLFDSELAYEYDHAEPGFSVPRPRVIGVHSQPPAEPPASATVGGDRDGTSRPPSPSSFPSPISGDFLYCLAYPYSGTLYLQL
jgi:hypothetical protein